MICLSQKGLLAPFACPALMGAGENEKRSEYEQQRKPLKRIAPNLFRDESSGAYYGRVKVKGKRVIETLKLASNYAIKVGFTNTNKIYTAAQLKTEVKMPTTYLLSLDNIMAQQNDAQCHRLLLWLAQAVADYHKQRGQSHQHRERVVAE